MNCIVVDDEPLAREGMRLLIEQVPGLILSGSFPNAVAAYDFMKGNPVDILFLDIHMPKINGMDFIRSLKHRAKIIITTAYPQFAVEAFELDVVDYLVKPIRFERFYKAVNRIGSSGIRSTGLPGIEDDYVFIRTERKYVRTHYREIDYVEGLKDYVIMHCGNEKHIVAANLKAIAACLPDHLFFRVNKSFVVNVSKIKSIDNDHVIINNMQLPIGESFKKSIIAFLSNKKVIKRS